MVKKNPQWFGALPSSVTHGFWGPFTLVALCKSPLRLRWGILAHLNNEVAPSFETQEKYSALLLALVVGVAALMISELPLGSFIPC